MPIPAPYRILLLSTFLLAANMLAFGQNATDTEIEFIEEKKEKAREQLKRIFNNYDLDDWIFTTAIQVKHGIDAHSHPVLTMNTNHLNSDQVQLSVFIHENAHWFVGDDRKKEKEQRVITRLKELYPSPPEKKQKNLYHHIMVVWVEYDALIELFGEEKATTIIKEKIDYYTRENPDSPLAKNFIWYYNIAMNNAQEVGKIMKKYGFIINPGKGIVLD